MTYTPIARVAQVDGLVFKFDTPDEQERQRLVGHFRNELAAVSRHKPGSPDWDRLFKVRIFNMAKDRSARAILKLELYGVMAHDARRLPAGYLSNLFELHVKGYALPVNHESADELRRALFDTEGKQQLTMFGRKPQAHASKGDGQGFRIGSRKSDFHAVAYKRTGQHLGIELRLKDTMLHREAARALEEGVTLSLADDLIWSLVLSRAGSVAEERFRSDLAARGVDLAEYVARWTSHAYPRNDSFDPIVDSVPESYGQFMAEASGD